MLKHKYLFCTSCAFLWLFAFSPSSAQTTDPGISAILQTDHNTVFQHETCTITLSVHSKGIRLGKKLELLGLPHETRLQYISDFEELPLKRTQTGEIRRFMAKVRAAVPGIIKISPVLRVAVLTRRRAFIGWRWVEQPREIRIRPLTLHVEHLPTAGRPGNFSGAVGQFTFDVDVAPRDVAVGDLITAAMKIHGDGYLREILSPRLSPGRDFKVYDPKLVSDISDKEKVFEQVLIPQSTNAVVIPALSFSYFDPRTRAYRTLTRGPFPITFHPPRIASYEAYQPATSSSTTNTGVIVPVPGTLNVFQRLSRAFRDGFRKGRKAVITHSETARLAPAHSAVSSFELPEGSIVRVLDTSGEWAKISFGSKRGWIPASSLEH